MMSSSVQKRSDTLQAADTLRETFDEESQHPGGHRRSSDFDPDPNEPINAPINASNASSRAGSGSASAAQPQRKGRAGLVFGGMIALLLVIALAVGLTTRGGSDETAASTAAATPEAPKEVPSGTIATLGETPPAPPKVPEAEAPVAALADEGQVATLADEPTAAEPAEAAPPAAPEAVAAAPSDAQEGQAAAAEPADETAEEAAEEAAAAEPADKPENKPDNSIFGSQVNEGSADDSEGSPQETQPEPVSEPQSEPESQAETQPEPEAQPTESESQEAPEDFAPEPQEQVGDAALVVPVEEVLAVVTGSPTASPVVAPTPPPTAEPTAKPTTEPTEEPTPAPTPEPTAEPTPAPTDEPTAEPTPAPTNKPIDLSGWDTFNWSGETEPPTDAPTPAPTPAPTDEPTTSAPTVASTPPPTTEPTPSPTEEPTPAPTPPPTDAPTPPPTDGPTDAPTPSGPFFFGEEFYYDEDLDIDVSVGLTVKPIAWTGRPVPYADGGESKSNYHEDSDAAGIISMNPADPLNSGYVYVANAEKGDGEGGVYGIYFDKDGNILEYKALLTGTTDNCGGGYTPWNTWVTCEEYSEGQVYEIDPVSGDTKKTALGGNGGRYESMACDDRDRANLKFFTTEDHERGALRRYETTEFGWGALHGGGTETFLNIIDGNTYEWTTDEELARDSAERDFPNSEGIQVHEGKLYFMSKVDRKLLVLDLENMTYTTEITGKKMYGEGDFGDQPDQNYFGPSRKYMYFTEDGGGDPGVHARYGEDGTYFTLFQGRSGGLYDDDETVGIALSPDHKTFYAGFQEYGIIFAVTRDDGLAFE